MVRDLPANHGQPGGIAGSTRATCRLRWTLDFDQAQDQWQLDGMIEAQRQARDAADAARAGVRRPRPVGPRRDVGLRAALAPSDAGRRTSAAWRSSFHASPDAERHAFRKTLTPPRRDPRQGLVRRRVAGGRSRSVPRPARRAAVGDVAPRPTPDRGVKPCVPQPRRGAATCSPSSPRDTPLERFAPTLPAHDDLLTQAKRRTPSGSGRSLRPWTSRRTRCQSTTCSPLRDRRSATSAIAAIESTRRGAGCRTAAAGRCGSSSTDCWPGTHPRKVLLCDRYVRGDDNLASAQAARPGAARRARHRRSRSGRRRGGRLQADPGPSRAPHREAIASVRAHASRTTATSWFCPTRVRASAGR
jgi:hypothetical protein